ncbi:sulfurtransferase complex subunit TusD [Psychrobacter raelei]|uniref:Sulfurtransferase complex subunit TusD n=1 Tax=Psychrobacter raelei TaxID=2565531 RepID=A0AAT9PF36_9GAMM|nr:sulfurtransferase complex subunit TusD [Psychrobacter sp. PraFG1]UNK06241.1 sulfurtransferase complex subunit TusD [Psychrobacter sp. PraFG1]
MTTTTLLLITADPSQPLAWHAYRYAKAFMQHTQEADTVSPAKLSIFFYADAANTANALRWQSADRADLTQLWSQFSAAYQQRLPVCVSTALTRGVTDEDNAARHRLQTNNLAAGFELVGLGELAEQMALATKVIRF